MDPDHYANIIIAVIAATGVVLSTALSGGGRDGRVPADQRGQAAGDPQATHPLTP